MIEKNDSLGKQTVLWIGAQLGVCRSLEPTDKTLAILQSVCDFTI